MIKSIALTFTMVLGVCLGLGACGKSKADELMSEATSIKNELCACKDAACVEKVKEKGDKFEDKLQSTWKSEKDAPKDFVEKYEKLEDEMRACRDKIEGGGDPE